jgi:hypothetical protein
MVRASVHAAVSANMPVLMTNMKSPKVMRVMGIVRTLTIEPMKAFTNPKMSAIQRNDQRPPETSMPGISAAATQITNAEMAHRSNNCIKRLLLIFWIGAVATPTVATPFPIPEVGLGHHKETS